MNVGQRVKLNTSINSMKFKRILVKVPMKEAVFHELSQASLFHLNTLLLTTVSHRTVGKDRETQLGEQKPSLPLIDIFMPPK